jgi:hypothetical protein
MSALLVFALYAVFILLLSYSLFSLVSTLMIRVAVATQVKSSNGFGILALASVCPIVTVLITGLIIRFYQWRIGESDPEEPEDQVVINGISLL